MEPLRPDDLDPLIHAPKRLSILAILRGGTVVEFQYLKHHLGLSDSDLSKQMTALTTSGLVSAKKRQSGSNRSTWYRMTAKGRRAFDRHVRSLESLIELSKQFDDMDEDSQAQADGGVDGGVVRGVDGSSRRSTRTE